MLLHHCAGEYSAERLQQLRQHTKQLPVRPTRKAESSAGGGFKLSGSFKAAAKPADDRFEVNASDLVRMTHPEVLTSWSRSHLKPHVFGVHLKHSVLSSLVVRLLCVCLLISHVFAPAEHKRCGRLLKCCMFRMLIDAHTLETFPQMLQPAKQPYRPPPPARGGRDSPAAGATSNGSAAPQQATAQQPAAQAAPHPAAKATPASPGSDSDEDGGPAFSIPNKELIRSVTLSRRPYQGMHQIGQASSAVALSA